MKNNDNINTLLDTLLPHNTVRYYDKILLCTQKLMKAIHQFLSAQ